VNGWLVVGIVYAVVALGTMIFLNIVEPPEGPLTNEMTEDEAAIAVIGLFWPVLLLLIALGQALYMLDVAKAKKRRRERQ
jgi:hypothetical protein